MDEKSGRDIRTQHFKEVMSTGDFNKCAADFDTKARGKGGKDSGPQPLDNLEAERELL